MKKIIVAIALLLVATLALSVSAFGADVADYGVEKYYLGEAVKTAPNADGAFGANEYAVTYTLNKGVCVTEDGKVLEAAADADALTTSVKVGLAYDNEYIYVAIEAALDEKVALADYVVYIDDADYKIGVGYDKLNMVPGSEGYYASKYTVSAGKFVGELKIDNDLVTVEKPSNVVTVGDTEFTMNIVENTYADVNGKSGLNTTCWNVVELSSDAKLELNIKLPYVANSFVLGSVPAAGTVVTVEQEPVGVPGQSTEAATTEAPTTDAPTEAPTTDAPTEAPTTEAPATDAPTEAPATEAPAVTEPTDEGGCGSSVAAMGIALVAALGTCAVVVSKKKED